MIRSFTLAAALLACSTIFSAAYALNQAADEKTEVAAKLPNCPVMGEAINFAVSTPTDDGPVYFCCAKCIEKYQADPAKYADQVAEQRKLLADRPKVQVICPVDQGAVDKRMQLAHEGGTVFVCSENCKHEFEADPAKYKAALVNCFTYQTMCPVMGEPINPKVKMALPGGEVIYVCCKKCLRKLVEMPESFNENLVSQGVVIDWEKARSEGNAETGSSETAGEKPGEKSGE